MGDSLFVILGDLVTRSVKWEKLSDLRESDPESRRSFEIDEDGSFIRWRSFDIHLGAVHFLEILNPEYVAQIEIDDISRWLVGDAVRTVRERHNLYQTDFQGLSDRQVRRIENGESSLTISAAKEFADSFGISLSDFVEELARTTASLRKGGDRNAVSRAY